MDEEKAQAAKRARKGIPLAPLPSMPLEEVGSLGAKVDAAGRATAGNNYAQGRSDSFGGQSLQPASNPSSPVNSEDEQRARAALSAAGATAPAVAPPPISPTAATRRIC